MNRLNKTCESRVLTTPLHNQLRINTHARACPSEKGVRRARDARTSMYARALENATAHTYVHHSIILPRTTETTTTASSSMVHDSNDSISLLRHATKTKLHKGEPTQTAPRPKLTEPPNHATQQPHTYLKLPQRLIEARVGCQHGKNLA